MAWKYHPVLAKVRRIARLRHKFRSSLGQRGLAKTIRHGWYKVRRRLSGDVSSTYRQWQKENRRRDLAEALLQGWRKVRRRLGWISSDDYQNWIAEFSPRFGDLARQRRWAKNTEGLPRILLLITTAGCSQEEIARTVRSLRRQTYPLWSPIHVESLGSVKSLQLASGDLGCAYAGVMRAGDTLSPDALYEFARIVHDHPDDRPALIYCDEDHLAADGRTRSQPIFKPAWSPEMCLGYDYMGRLTLVRRDLMGQAGGFDPGMGEAAEWDLKLRVSSLSGRVVRITRCLYHNRSAADVRQVRHGGEQARAALRAHLARLGIEGGDAALQPNGTFRVHWPLPAYPLVCIVVPTVDSPQRIERCVRGLMDETSYPNKEIILVDNGSTDAETLAFYDQWKASGAVKIVPFDQPFNYSAACNAGAAAAKGEYLLFLNNDIEFVSPDWLEELVRWAQRPNVGVVGPKMIYPIGTVNHAGIAVTLDACVNLYQDQVRDRWGIFGHVDSYKNTSGLQGACHLMSRSTYMSLGRYDERYLLIFSDVSICLEACRAGFRNVYTPYAVLIHDESTTRREIGDPSDDWNLAAREIVRLAYFEDPYFHPSLKPRVRTPSLRPAYEPDSAEYFSWLLSRGNPGVLRDLELDLYDDASVRDVAGRWSAGLGPAHWSPAKVGADPVMAASFVLHLLRTDPSLRTGFPRALSEGPEGAFCQWLCSPEALTRYGLPVTAQNTIRKAFEARLSATIRQVYELRRDLQRSYLLAYLPAGRARFFRWLISDGKEVYEFSNPAIWWFLIECDEDPERELIRSYKISAWWQRFFPDALTPLGWERFASWLESRHGIDAHGLDYRDHSRLTPIEELRLAYGCRGDWKRRFPAALEDVVAMRELLAWIREHEGATDPRILDWLCRIEAEIDKGGFARTGINVLAYFCYPCGLQESVSWYVRCLQFAGVSTSCRDVPTLLSSDNKKRDEFLGLETYDTTLIHVQPESHFLFVYERAGLAPRRGVYLIAMWWWETDVVPESWKLASKSVNEIWAASRFVAGGLRRALDVPVYHIPLGFEVGPVRQVDLSSYGVPAGSFAFLFIFDLNSTFERKNPLGLISAFKQAFQSGEKVSLIIKVSRGARYPEEFYRLRKEAKQVGAIVIDKRLPREELNGLIAACDCYVSLHRSEGLGLTLAEAMMLGKPSIATAYSGNLDFMDKDNSLLVGYDLTEIESPAGPYEKGHRWAEPSIPEAANAMRWVFNHPEEAQLLGERARLSTVRCFSPHECGSRMLDRLNQIRSERSRK
jgi:GT2 family glycosyltransferase/glycosyltransferase involved in cell wall biosynthesis